MDELREKLQAALETVKDIEGEIDALQKTIKEGEKEYPQGVVNLAYNLKIYIHPSTRLFMDNDTRLVFNDNYEQISQMKHDMENVMSLILSKDWEESYVDIDPEDCFPWNEKFIIPIQYPVVKKYGEYEVIVSLNS